MSRIVSKDALPEVRVRKVLHRLGLRYRLHRKDLPAKPDIALRQVEDSDRCPRKFLARP